MKIGYLTFGRDDFGYGLAISMAMIKGHEIYRITPKTAKYVDVVLFSCFWWEHIYVLADFLRAAGLKKNSYPKIIVGGFNTFNPIPFSKYADVVVVGDGEEVLPRLIEDFNYCGPGVFREGDKEVVWKNSEVLMPFCWDTNKISRIEIARGCKFSCKFCAVAHLKPYREVPINDLEKLIKTSREKRVALFAPEPIYYSERTILSDICKKHGKRRSETDVRLENIDKTGDGGVRRVGVEGISEKLRRSIGKNFSHKYVFDKISNFIKSNKCKGLLLYFIVDLPGENSDDWRELKQLLLEIGEVPGATKFLLKCQGNTFMPSPHTPLEYESINFNVDYRNIWADFFCQGVPGSKPWKAQIVGSNTIFGTPKRILSMLSTRAGSEFKELDECLIRNKAYTINNGELYIKNQKILEKSFLNYGGIEKYCGRYTIETAPWKVVKFIQEDYGKKKCPGYWDV